MTSSLDLLPSGRFFSPALLVLLSLSESDKHGYALMEAIKRDHGIDIGPGTLYAALARLEKRGMIVSIPSADRRRPYRLTPVGAEVLRDQLLDLQHAAALGLERLASL